MRHVVIGNGNLGNALASDLLKQNHNVKVLSTSNGWKYPTNLQALYDFTPDHVWVTVGAGSVEQAKQNYLPFIDLHIRLPLELAQNLNKSVYLHTFSTDYALDAPIKSLYALSKVTMEEALKLTARPNTYIYRVGSLYGTHKPHKCFPYKIKKNSLKNEEVYLPVNCVTPTPTDWLAKILIENLEYLPENDSDLYNVAPQDNCTIWEWGKLILKMDIKTWEKPDLDRPLNSNIRCNLPGLKLNPELFKTVCSKSWLTLWHERENEWQEILSKIV